jgi:uncharacterized protein
MDMAKRCLKEGTPFGVCLITQGREVGEPAIPAPVGTLARIAQWDMPQLGLLHVLALGELRFRILERRVQPDALGVARIEMISEETDEPVATAYAHCVRLLERLIARTPALFAEPYRLDSSAWVSARLAELLPLPLELKQELLELGSGELRLERISALLRADARSAS